MEEKKHNLLPIIWSLAPLWGAAAYLFVLLVILGLFPLLWSLYPPDAWGYVESLLRTRMLNYTLLAVWVFAGIPVAALLVVLLFRVTKRAYIQLLFFICVSVVMIPFFTLSEYGVLRTIRETKSGLAALEQGAYQVYTGRFSSVSIGGGPFPGEPGLYVLRFSTEDRLYNMVYCPVSQGREVGLFTYHGGQAKGQDYRRFRIEYVEEARMVLSITLLDS